MKRIHVIIALLVIPLLMWVPVLAGEHLYITLKVPTAAQVDTPNGKSIFIQSVMDNRFFGGQSSPVDVPSWGVHEKEQTDELKHRAVGRSVLRGGREVGNVLTGMGDVRSITQSIVSSSLKGLGYSVIERKEEMKDDTIVVDIAINKFWGYFKEAFIGGSINATIETTITLHKEDRIEKKTIQVTAKQSARYPNKPANWEIVFNTVLGDYLGAVMKELKK